jgi:hypothetical protein
MRELLGKIPTKDPRITEVVYLSELVRCLECQKTAPMGIEVVTVKKDGDSKKVLRSVRYCRSHGYDYETKLQSLPMHPHAQSETWLRFNNGDWGTPVATSSSAATNLVGPGATTRD